MRRRAMEAAADESGVKDVAKDLRTATSARSMGLDAVKEAAERFEKWDPLKEPRRAAPAAAEPTAAAAGPPTAALAETQAARKAAAQEAATALRKAERPAAPAATSPEGEA
jgi:sec-independent protein translocase protein TatB